MESSQFALQAESCTPAKAVALPRLGRPGVSIIVPVRNGGPAFGRCLESLAGLNPAPDEVIIVEDGDSDGGGSLAGEFGFSLLRRDDRGGPAGARNDGAAQARGDILFFIDADVTLPPDALARVLAAFETEPALSAVIGSYDDAPAAGNFLSQYRNLFHHYIHQTSGAEAGTFWGACGAIRREAFERMGGFDESYRSASVEDIELGYRLRQAGCRIRLCKGLQVKHWKAWKPLGLVATDFARRALPWTALLLRTGRMDKDLNLRTSSRVSVALSCLLLAGLLAAPFWPWLLLGAGVLAAALLAINWPVYRFLASKRGWRFALASCPWHWIYYLTCGTAFALGLTTHLLAKLAGRKERH